MKGWPESDAVCVVLIVFPIWHLELRGWHVLWTVSWNKQYILNWLLTITILDYKLVAAIDFTFRQLCHIFSKAKYAKNSLSMLPLQSSRLTRGINGVVIEHITILSASDRRVTNCGLKAWGFREWGIKARGLKAGHKTRIQLDLTCRVVSRVYWCAADHFTVPSLPLGFL